MSRETRQRLLFDAAWRFERGDPAGAEQPAFDDAAWQEVDLPHDWSIAGPFDPEAPCGSGGGYLPGGIGWYRKHFSVDEADRGRRLAIEFDAVYKNCDVWLNGHHLGFHPYGYTGSAYDLTPYLDFGPAGNVLAVRVDDSTQPDSRWYTGAGIYRHTWLTVTSPVHVAHWGTYVSTPGVSEEQTLVLAQIRVQNDSPDIQRCLMEIEMIDADGAVVASVKRLHALLPGQEEEFVRRLHLSHPHLWSVEDPYLYRLHTTLRLGDELVDEHDTPFGIRTVAFDADQGFLLNGRRVKIKGVCLHHDAGCVGAAVPDRVLERRLELLKAMGCNGIRCSHYPPAPELLDMADRMGFLVMDEAFDEWAQERYAFGYHDHFDEWAIRDLESMLYRDRNHPSIVLWSVGNEIPEQTRVEGIAILHQLVDVVHRLDPTRPTVSACEHIAGPDAFDGPTQTGFLETLDVVGYNYVDRWAERRKLYYSLDHHLYPHRAVIGSENVSIAGIRGEYSADGEGAGWRWSPYYSRMFRGEQLWKFTDSYDYVSGDYMWTGFDYLGESRWPHKGSSCGPLDTCGFPKDSYYFYQSQWTQTPMVHLFPHWNWAGREGEVIPVVCYSNCDSVELFVNGRSWGVKSYAYAHYGMDRSKSYFDQTNIPPVWPTTADLHLTWNVPYEPGTLRAVGRKSGEIVCECQVATAGAQARIDLAVDRAAIAADGRDVVHVTARVLDAEGRPVPTASHLLTFAVAGPGRLIGVDNGDPASHESFAGPQRHAFNGLCLAIVQAAGQAGELSISATADGLAPMRVAVAVVRP